MLQKKMKYSKKDGQLALDGHFIIFFFALCFLVGYIFYLSATSTGDYLVQKYQYAADRIAGGMNLKAATDKEIESLMTMYRAAIDQNPHATLSAKIHINVAQIYTMRGDFGKAIEELKTVIHNFSKKQNIAAEARFLIGKIYEKKGELSEAVSIYNEVISYHPLTQKGLVSPLYIAELYKSKGREAKSKEAYDEALTHYQRQLKKLGDISHSAILINFIALTYSSQNMWEEATREWQKLIKEYPKSGLVRATLMALGETYSLRLGEPQKAIEFYERVIREFSKTEFATEAKVRLMQTYFHTKEYTGARYWAKEILRNQSVKPALRSEVMLILARTFEKEGNWQKAEKYYDEVVLTYPSSQAALRVPIIKAKHFEAAGDEAEASKIYEGALKHYEVLADQEKDQELAINAQDLISMSYMGREDWPSLMQHLDGLLADAKHEKRRGQLMLLKANILKNKVQDAPAAIAAYEDFLRFFPNDILVDYVEEELKVLREQLATEPAVENQEPDQGTEAA